MKLYSLNMVFHLVFDWYQEARGAFACQMI